MTQIDQTLQERGTRYGEFNEHARITQNIKRAMQDSKNWMGLQDDMKEALEMLAHKVGRILNGDPFYHDSWHDIIGYTKLVADRLEVLTETFCKVEELFTPQEINEMIDSISLDGMTQQLEKTSTEVAARNYSNYLSKLDQQALNGSCMESPDDVVC